MCAFQIVYSPSGLIDIFNIYVCNTKHTTSECNIRNTVKKKAKRNSEIDFDLFVSRLNDNIKMKKEKTIQLDLFPYYRNIFVRRNQDRPRHRSPLGNSITLDKNACMIQFKWQIEFWHYQKPLTLNHVTKRRKMKNKKLIVRWPINKRNFIIFHRFVSLELWNGIFSVWWPIKLNGVFPTVQFLRKHFVRHTIQTKEWMFVIGNQIQQPPANQQNYKFQFSA